MNGMFTAESSNFIYVGEKERGAGSWPSRIIKVLILLLCLLPHWASDL